jgi:K+-transporting ATPase ATPase C chain
MMSVMISAARASLVAFVLCGLLYPLALTGLGQLILPFQANGSLERGQDGTIVGSRLIGQQWNGPEWFHGRPSATTDTDPDNPSKTVPHPTMRRIPPARTWDRQQAPDGASDERSSTLEAAQRARQAGAAADMLTTSASGLDPDISPANAVLQADRVASARGVPATQIHSLVEQHVTGRSFGIFGEPRVNVLTLNLALQRAYPSKGACLGPRAADCISSSANASER